MKKAAKILIIVFAIYVVFAAVILTLFHYIRDNPIDQIAMTYLWENIDVSDMYGEINHIGRNVFNKAEKNEFTVKRPYGVETETAIIIVYVTLEKSNGDWTAVSYEITEVIPNGK